ncbi:MAG: hypothetical protein GX914_05175 [Erysipelotrichia bacterium]|nr:hypothetical protein [Erysipelotrichia bacterium]
MKKLLFLIKRVFKMDYKQMFETIDAINKKTGISKLAIFKDMTNCAIKYGSGYSDYNLFEMYDLTDEQRDTYITRGRNNGLVLKYNDKNYRHFIDNKVEFNERYGEFLKREWIKVDGSKKEDVINFLKKHSSFMAKPIIGTCGVGIEKIKVQDFENYEKLYQYLINKNFLLEELIKQHDEINKVYSGAVNTARVVTILKEDKLHFICVCFRIGNSGFVDNFHNGGMLAPVDIETGTVMNHAVDRYKNLYVNHPQTGYQIKGFKFPDWKEALEMCEKASHITPEVRYVGWDVAFSNKGPLLIEANDIPAYDLFQLPAHRPDRKGVWHLFNI